MQRRGVRGTVGGSAWLLVTLSATSCGPGIPPAPAEAATASTATTTVRSTTIPATPEATTTVTSTPTARPSPATSTGAALPSPILARALNGDLLLIRGGEDARVLLPGATDGWLSAELSADGRAAFVGRPLAGSCGEIVHIETTSGVVTPTGIRGDDPLPSPDGQFLAYTRSSAQHWGPGCDTELVVVDLDTRTERSWRVPSDTSDVIDLVGWSPDGLKLAFSLSWESPHAAGILDLASEDGEELHTSPHLVPADPHYWRASTFLNDGRLALVGWCCWYYVPEHRQPRDVERAPHLLTAAPGERPVESFALPSEWSAIHRGGEHFLWVDDGVLWFGGAGAERIRVADGIEWATW